MRVLLIDDAAVARAAFAHVARHAGIDATLEAADAEAGIALALRERPDAIVVDGRLPPDGGLAVIARIRLACPSTPILVLAALNETGLVRSAVALGAAGALLRPVLPSQLARSLAACVASPPPQ